MSETSEDSIWTRAATLADFQGVRSLVREVDGIDILLCRLGGDIVAVRNYCTHLGKPLATGRIMAGQITCAFHGACFDLRTGAALSGPAVIPLHRFPVRLVGEEIWLDLSRRPSALSGFPPSQGQV